MREAIKKTEKKINEILYIPKLLCVVRINDIMDVIMNWFLTKLFLKTNLKSEGEGMSTMWSYKIIQKYV